MKRILLAILKESYKRSWSHATSRQRWSLFRHTASPRQLHDQAGCSLGWITIRMTIFWRFKQVWITTSRWRLFSGKFYLIRRGLLLELFLNLLNRFSCLDGRWTCDTAYYTPACWLAVFEKWIRVGKRFCFHQWIISGFTVVYAHWIAVKSKRQEWVHQ